MASLKELARQRVVRRIVLGFVPEAALICLPRTQAVRRFAQYTPLLGISQCRLDGHGHRRDLVLHGKDMLEVAVVAPGPMCRPVVASTNWR